MVNRQKDLYQEQQKERIPRQTSSASQSQVMG